jgi:uncharacterized membrane protein
MNRKNTKKLMLTAAALLVLAAAVYFVFPRTKGENFGSKSHEIKTVKDADIVIPISSVSEDAAFYPAEMKGTKLEVIAVKASDGSIRTAFNTCQVCFSSGRGYYEQEGDELICQNCGNRFRMDDVEVTRGGCNPVPITEEFKSIDGENIIISKDYLTQATIIFQNWK